MHRILLNVILILGLLTGSLDLPWAGRKPPGKLTQLTIINKAGTRIGVRLTGQDTKQFYYLQVNKGTLRIPVTKTFTVVQDTYSVQVDYIEYWDPVYGYRCGAGPGAKLTVQHNSRINLAPCKHKGRYTKEFGALKLPADRQRGPCPAVKTSPAKPCMAMRIKLRQVLKNRHRTKR